MAEPVEGFPDAGIERLRKAGRAAERMSRLAKALGEAQVQYLLGLGQESRAMVSSMPSPTCRRTAGRSGAGRPSAAKAAAMTDMIACWLSTRVPSTSKTIRRKP
jgi:hypothetical protein